MREDDPKFKIAVARRILAREGLEERFRAGFGTV